jgi:hypothetical protein
MCPDCGSPHNHGYWYAVKFPANAKQIGELLAVRPISNRNWKPGESATSLKDENKAQGIG